MKCLIVDDNEMSRIALQTLCRNINEVEVVGLCQNASEAMQLLQEQEVDLLLLDIEMPDITGMDLVKSLEEIPLIIFITSKTEYAAEAFALREWVVDYLTKPVNLPRLKKAIQAAQKMAETEEPKQFEQYIFVRASGKIVRIDLTEIEYLETVGDYVRFKTGKQSILVHGTIKNMESKLQHPDLMKVNRSYIVNLSKIKDIEDHSILIGEKIIPVSRAHRGPLLKRINPL